MSRPDVSVVVPFGGDAAEAAELLAGLRALRLQDGDEVLLADNSLDGALSTVAQERVRTVRADGERSSYHARNIGADAARAAVDWLVFIDSDCRPEPDLLDRYFDVPIPDDVGLVAGRVTADEGGGGSLAQRFAASRRALDQEDTLARGEEAFAATANVLVRRAALADVTGFCEGIRSGGDADLSWRLRAAGWRLMYQPGAVVAHKHRLTFAELVHQRRTYGCSGAWLARRHGRPPRWPDLVTGIARSAVAAVAFPLTGQPRRGLFKAIDGVLGVAMLGGTLRSNRARAFPGGPPRAGDVPGAPAVVRDVFPALDAPAPAPAADVYALRRPPLRPHAAVARPSPHWYAEDDGSAQRWLDLAHVAARRPAQVTRALRADARGALQTASLARRLLAARPPTVDVTPAAGTSPALTLLLAGAEGV